MLMMSIVWGGSIHTVHRNTEALIVGSEEIGLAVNVEEGKD